MNYNDEKLILNPHLKFIQINSNEILIKHSGKSIYSKLLEDEGKKGIISKVFDNFRKPLSINEYFVLEKIEIKDDREEIIDFIKYCENNNIIIKSDSDPIFAYYKLLIGKTEKNINDLVIGIIGGGILGSRIIKNLSALGVEKFIVLDDRIIENENIESKFFEYKKICKNQKYTELARENFEEVVECFDDYNSDNLEKTVIKCDFLICAQDFLKSTIFHRLNLICIEKNKPWVMAYIDGSECCAGPIFVPGETCCFNEFEIQNDAAFPATIRKDYSLYREYLDDNKNKDSFLILPPYSDILSGILSTEIFKFLISSKSVLINSCIKLELENMDFDLVTILRLPRCPACEKHDGFKNMFL